MRVTIIARFQECCGSSGICSMNRRCRPSATAQRSRAGASWSLTPRMSTVFTFTGVSPASRAAVMPARTSGSRSRSVRRWKVSRLSVSQETFTRVSPASASGPARRASRSPFVVSGQLRRPRKRSQPGDDVHDVGAYQRLAASEPHLGDAQVGAHAHQPDDLVGGEQLG